MALSIKISPAKSLRGEINIPGDKSISHRALMLGAISEGNTQIENFGLSEDCLRTVEAIRALGVEVALSEETKMAEVKGQGLRGLNRPEGPIYLGNSGTSMRLLMGILAGQNFQTTLTGDEFLIHRPMRRVAEPLREMGARIDGRDGGNYAPITISGGKLKAITYNSPIASAQVKSAILLAGLYAEGTTSVGEPYKSRDHTERMLERFGADVKVEGTTVRLKGKALALKAKGLVVPGDVSSAAFFIVAATILPDSEIVIKSVEINPTRTGIIDILNDMGASIERSGSSGGDYEPRADLRVKSSKLHGTLIERDALPRVIDELPILMVAGLFAEGETIIRDASELRVKETDRIKSMVANLKAMGGDIRAEGDTVIIKGGRKLRNGKFDSYGDHRTAMAMLIAGLAAEGAGEVENCACIDKSFPQFMDLLGRVRVDNS